MANDARANRKTRDDEGNSSKKKQSSGKGSTSSGSAMKDSSGLRRSSRETPKKQKTSSPPSSTKKPEQVASPSSTKKPGQASSSSSKRKSERLEKQLPTTPAKRKSERVEKQRTESPLRKSERTKKTRSTGSSGSKKTSSPSVTEKKEKREKSVKELAKEAKEAKKESEPVNGETRRLDSRSYRALFKPRVKIVKASVPGGKLKKRNKLSLGDSDSKQVEDRDSDGSSPSGSERNNGSRSGDVDDLKVHKTGDNSSLSSNGVKAKKATKRRKKKQLLEQDLVGPTSEEKPIEADNDLDRDDKVSPRKKRKRNVPNLDSDLGNVTSKEICSPAADVVLSLSPSGGCERNGSPETCNICSKTKRVGGDSQKQKVCSCEEQLNQDLSVASVPKDGNSNQGLSDTSILKDRVDLEASCTAGFADKGGTNSQQQLEIPPDILANDGQNICVNCKLGGKLLCCDGKGCERSYHISCLDPPLADVPPGVWHCYWCVKQKVELGVHSVSSGIESICDVKEVEVNNAEGPGKEKQYFVKYKGLAHVHNRWLSENELLVEAPFLVSNFKRKNQGTRWRLEWTVPQRLLQKRLVSQTHHDENYVVWLVKWRGLGYEHVSWEFDTASFLNSPEAQGLKREYETRREKAKNQNHTPLDKAVKLVKLRKLPIDDSSGVDINQLSLVNKLREHWHRGQNAVIYDDQERVTKAILFILSLQTHVCRPFLIIATSTSIPFWEDAFLRLAPSVTVVVYNGHKDNRKTIRSLEFYDEGGSIMFQVLLSAAEAIIEDLEELEFLGWETVIVDECQRNRTSSRFEELKRLVTEFRLVLLSAQIKENIYDYLNLLSFLDSPVDKNSGPNDKSSDGSNSESSNGMGALKERLSHFIVYESKSDSPRFVEYWVPAQISSVQLEQYCATLLSNYISLCSSTSKDLVGVLQDILISARKCCDHPYIVEPSLQSVLTNGIPPVEILDVGIKASGKLQLLDAMLQEIKNRGLRVIVLFQSIGGSGRDSIGDILDDFVRQRFGPDSYERIDGCGSIPSKKQAVLNKFNDKESGRFVFLLENRACLPSIKLSAVDTIIVFDSEWNPLNDIRALQRITLDSHLDQINVFRLYTINTVEEKALVLQNQDRALDSNWQSIKNRNTSHVLLMWGASYLFKNLEEFHRSATSSLAITTCGPSFLKDVVQEFLTILTPESDSNEANRHSYILKIQQNGGTNSRKFSLADEMVHSNDGEKPSVFWTKLLEGKNPRWKYLSVQSQRNRKRVQHFDSAPKNIESEELTKTRKKVLNNGADATSPKPRLEPEVESEEVVKKRKKVVDVGKSGSGDKKGAPATPADNGSQSVLATGSSAGPDDRRQPSETLSGPEGNMVESEEKRKVNDAPQGLHLRLKQEVLELCEILKLPAEVKRIAERFLEYVINNHRITGIDGESLSMLQAFELSLCWAAASMLKHSIDRKESLALAKQRVSFICKEEDLDYLYSKLKLLKTLFLIRTKNPKESNSPKDPISATEGALHARVSQLISNPKKVKVESEERPITDGLSPQNNSMSIGDIQKDFHKQMKNLLRNQQQEVQEFQKGAEAGLERLEVWYRIESGIIHNLNYNNSVRSDKLKNLSDEYARRKEQHKRDTDARLKVLEEKQLVERNKIRDKIVHSNSSSRAGPSETPVNVSAQTSSALPEKQNSSNVELEARASIPGSSSSDAHEEIATERSVSGGDQVPNGSISCVPDGEVPLDGENSVEPGVNPMASDGCSDGNGVDQHDVAGSAMVQDSVASDICVGSSPSAPQVAMASQSCPLPCENQPTADSVSRVAPPNAISQPSTSPEAREGEGPATENQDTRQAEVPPNNEAPITQFISDLHIEAQPTVQIAQESPLHQDPGQATARPIQQLPVPLSMGPFVGGRGQEAHFDNTRTTPTNLEYSSRSNQVSAPTSASLLPPAPVFTLAPPTVSAPAPALAPIQVPAPTLAPPTAQGPGPAHVPMMTRVAQTSGPDPLQNEMDRIRKETDQYMKLHEDTISKMRSDCEREIEEVVAQIRRKYEALLQGTEAAFVHKRKELDVAHNKVLLNKMLAEALRSKCMDFKPSLAPGAPATQHVPAPPGFTVHHRFPQPVQHLPAPKTTAAPPQQPAAPPVQVVHHSAALFSGVSSRPLLINPMTPSTGARQMGSEIRAPAPHLQPFRPSTLGPTTSLPPPPRLHSAPPPRPPPPAVYHQPVPPVYRTHPPEASGGFPGMPRVSPSVVELQPMDIAGRAGGSNRPNIIPHVQDLGPDAYLWESAERVSPASSNLVCLSDDD